MCTRGCHLYGGYAEHHGYLTVYMLELNLRWNRRHVLGSQKNECEKATSSSRLPREASSTCAAVLRLVLPPYQAAVPVGAGLCAATRAEDRGWFVDARPRRPEEAARGDAGGHRA